MATPPTTARPRLGPDLGVDDAHDAIASMAVRGAAEIGRTAARAFVHEARHRQRLVSDDDERAWFVDAGRRLIAARPTAVTLRNAVNIALVGLAQERGEGIADRVEANATGFLDASATSAAEVARHGAALLPDEAVVVTHCHSSLAVAVLVEAHRLGKSVRVFADETRPWMQGHITARQLKDAGLDVTLIVDSAAHHVMRTEGVNAVVLGADTVTADGALYNKVGTHAVALGAASLEIPVHCASGIHKFSPYSASEGPPPIEERGRDEVLAGHEGRRVDLSDVPVRNPVFDRTDPMLVRDYVIETGVVRPDEVATTIRQHFGDTEGWL